MESLIIVVDCGVGQLEMLIMTARHIILVSLHADALLSAFIFWIQVEASTEAKRKDEVHTTLLVNLYECKGFYEAIEIYVFNHT